MKKFISILIAVVMIASLVAMLVGCGPTELSEVEKAIREAEEMTLEELVAAAKAEIGSDTLVIKGTTSGVVSVANAFKEEYGIEVDAKSLTDSTLYEQITAPLETNNYYADLVLIQDGNGLMHQIDLGNFINYFPNGYTTIADSDKDPLTAIYSNKLFIYKATGPTRDLYNVWQLAGKASDPGHISDLSFKDPMTELVNLNFLVMLTSPESCARLADAYKKFYGKDWVKPAGFETIGHQFISEFLNNVSIWHGSDTDAVRNIANGSYAPGVVSYAPLNKWKDAEKAVPGSTATMTFGGFSAEASIEGFSGFMYKTYMQVLKTAKYPYAACLFINYLTTNETAFKAGWKDVGYYSANTSVRIASGDQPLSTWSPVLIYEDPQFIYDVYDNAYLFISSEVSKAKS